MISEYRRQLNAAHYLTKYNKKYSLNDIGDGLTVLQIKKTVVNLMDSHSYSYDVSLLIFNILDEKVQCLRNWNSV